MKQITDIEDDETLRFAEYCCQIDYILDSSGLYWFCEHEERPNKTTKELYEMFKTTV